MNSLMINEPCSYHLLQIEQNYTLITQHNDVDAILVHIIILL